MKKGLLISVVLIMLDQITKLLAVLFLSPVKAFPLIPGIFSFYYLENHGAAFGMMAGKQFLFIMIALVIAAVSVYVFFCLPKHRHYQLMRCICILIFSGSVGNMIDRILHSYVIDFLYFSLIDFPVFNIADCYVCIGAALLLISTLTIYRNDDFKFIRF